MSLRPLRALGFVAVACAWSCGPTHLERAKSHHADGLQALRQSDAAGARGHFEQVVAEARASRADAEEPVPRQSHLLEGSAHLRLGAGEAAREALAAAHALGGDAERDWVEATLTADACELLRSADVAHAEALCWAHVMDVAPTSDVDLRIRATTEYGNALARRLPNTATLLALADPAFQRLATAASGAPLDVELLFVLSRRLPLFCADEAFLAHVKGYSQFQKDLLKAALALDWFRSDRARTEAAAYAKELEGLPLCGR